MIESSGSVPARTYPKYARPSIISVLVCRCSTPLAPTKPPASLSVMSNPAILSVSVPEVDFFRNAPINVAERAAG